MPKHNVVAGTSTSLMTTQVTGLCFPSVWKHSHKTYVSVLGTHFEFEKLQTPVSHWNTRSVFILLLRFSCRKPSGMWCAGLRGLHEKRIRYAVAFCILLSSILPPQKVQPWQCSCLIPAEFRKSGNYTDCLTPCTQEEYVPTTSFAILLNQDGSDMDQAKRDTLTEALFK